MFPLSEFRCLSKLLKGCLCLEHKYLRNLTPWHHLKISLKKETRLHSSKLKAKKYFAIRAKKVIQLRLQFNIFQARAAIQNSCQSSVDYFHYLLVFHFIYKMSQNVQDKYHYNSMLSHKQSKDISFNNRISSLPNIVLVETLKILQCLLGTPYHRCQKSLHY